MPVKEFSLAQKADSDLYTKLKSLTGVYVKKTEALTGFKEGFELAVVRPVDHNNPDGSKFTQRVYISHRDFKLPVVLETEGYAAPSAKERETAKLLNANQILVEHRYYESSKPKPTNWRYCTSWQAASDHHRIVQLLKNIYQDKWISSGRSKGGMAALFHRAYYPGDIDATIVYVAPIMFGPSDPRVKQFLNTAVDNSTQEKIRQFQKACLQKRNEILPIISRLLKESGMSFSLGHEEIFERTVLEFPYSFWWRNQTADNIPAEDSSAKDLLDYLRRVVPFSGFSNSEIKFNAALYYQQFTELGYFDYSAPHINELLKTVVNPHFLVYVPKEARGEIFNEEPMLSIASFLRTEGNNIIYLYGENDIYTSCMVDFNKEVDALKLIAKGKGHQFGIGDFTEDEKKKIFTTLENWLQIKIPDKQRKLK